MTKKRIINLSIFLLIASFLGGCEFGPQSLAQVPADVEAGPKAWVEFPLHGETMEMGPIPIVVYAASTDGISGITVSINGVPLPAGQLTPLTTDGSSRLVRTDLVWQPPAEGEYIVEANAGGASSSITFCVVTCQPEEETVTEPTATAMSTLPIITLPPDVPTNTPTPATSQTPTPTSYASPTPTATTYTESSAEFWAAPPYINAGECTTLNWNVTGDFQAVYFEGSSVSASGSDSECPAETTTYHLQVVEMDNSTTDYWTTVDVYEAPPADTTGPSINWTNLVWESCQFYGEAGISDESGVAWAQFYYNLNYAGWNSVWMSELSADYWQSEVGISVDDGMGTPVGTIEYYIIAGDTLGNQSESGTSTYDYMSCDG